LFCGFAAALCIRGLIKSMSAMKAIPVGENALIIKVDAEHTADCVEKIRGLQTQVDQLNFPG
jgi:hypothetical protein